MRASMLARAYLCVCVLHVDSLFDDRVSINAFPFTDNYLRPSKHTNGEADSMCCSINNLLICP